MKTEIMKTVVPFCASQSRRAGLRRLDRALARLDAAQKDQLARIRHHQEVLATLAERIARLEASCLDYQRALKRIDVGPLKSQALRLAEIMRPYAAQNGNRAA
ncbi:MAG: hypothetical protein GVY13_01275 [Alphaproteobacteria bacterium]|jgi:hypothetical protein|nr:hypothetical protein [Alphaproteobacteria bacterium]